jgi:hypothetical protein
VAQRTVTSPGLTSPTVAAECAISFPRVSLPSRITNSVRLGAVALIGGEGLVVASGFLFECR